MSNFNDSIENISIREFLIVIILTYLIWFAVNSYVHPISANWIYIFIIAYFAYKLRNSFDDFKNDLSNIFSGISIKQVLLIVASNILFSYGMLYFSDFLISIPLVNGIVNFSFTSMSLIAGVGSFLTIVAVSPICEEMIFRGIFLNKLKLIVPTVFALLISSLLFAALHSFGSIFSAFVFAMCMGVFYLKTENIFVPIFAHFLNNAVAETIVHADCQNMLFVNEGVVLIVSILAVLSFIVISFFLYNELNNFK